MDKTMAKALTGEKIYNLKKLHDLMSLLVGMNNADIKLLAEFHNYAEELIKAQQ